VPLGQFGAGAKVGAEQPPWLEREVGMALVLSASGKGCASPARGSWRGCSRSRGVPRAPDMGLPPATLPSWEGCGTRGGR